MNWKETYTKIFLKQSGKSVNELTVAEYMPLWWKNTRTKDSGGLRLTDAGFQFIKEPCNPCEALGPPSHSTCPFSLEHNKKVSPAWEKMWGLPSSPIQKLPERYPYWMN